MKKQENINRIHILAERYFEASATLAEERELKHLLAETAYSTPEIDVLRAVMGFAVVDRMHSDAVVSCRHRQTPVYMRVAASIGVALVAGAAIFTIANREENQDMCIYYAGDTEIRDKVHVMSVMCSELTVLDVASTSLENDIEKQFEFISEISTL